MCSCEFFCRFFAGINWWMFAVSIIAAYGISAVWYSLLFSKKWIEVFKVETTGLSNVNIAATMFFQFIATAFYGLIMFVLAGINVWLAVLVLLAFCAWSSGNLKFQFGRCKDFWWATLINVGHTFVLGLIFILFSLIR